MDVNGMKRSAMEWGSFFDVIKKFHFVPFIISVFDVIM